MGLKVLVTGGRDYEDADGVRQVLSQLHADKGIDLLVEGGACGVDFYASTWALKHGVAKETYDADWARHGLKAGPIRNTEMLGKHAYDLVVAFPGGAGTSDMVRKAKARGLTVLEVQDG